MTDNLAREKRRQTRKMYFGVYLVVGGIAGMCYSIWFFDGSAAWDVLIYLVSLGQAVAGVWLAETSRRRVWGINWAALEKERQQALNAWPKGTKH